MLVTTTQGLQDREIVEYRGVVFGEVVAGINFVKDLGAGFRNFFGGRSQGYEEELVAARNSALDEMMRRAKEIGCNGIIGVDFDFQAMGKNNGMILVSVTGTGIVFR